MKRFRFAGRCNGRKASTTEYYRRKKWGFAEGLLDC
jgi:hypothetical protein